MLGDTFDPNTVKPKQNDVGTLPISNADGGGPRPPKKLIDYARLSLKSLDRPSRHTVSPTTQHHTDLSWYLQDRTLDNCESWKRLS